MQELAHRARNLDTLWPNGQTIEKIHRNGAMYIVALSVSALMSSSDLHVVLETHCNDIQPDRLSSGLRRIRLTGADLISTARRETPKNVPILLKTLSPSAVFEGTIPEVVEQLLSLVHESRRAKERHNNPGQLSGTRPSARA